LKSPGVYFGQCSELCGVRHGFMPIAVEAVPEAQFNQWVKSKGGKLPGEDAAAEAAAPAAAANAAAPAK
jgi:cytochrome c oxidase subunit 2